MASSAIEQLVKGELQHYPGVELELKDGRKHDRAVFHFGAKSRFLTLPKTPSDWRSSQNIKRDLKKTLAELGVERASARKPRESGRHWSSDATLGLQAESLVLSVPKHSKLLKRFQPTDPRQAWSFELRASPDLSAPPMLVVKQMAIPEGMQRARSGIVRALRHKTGAVKIIMRRNALPELLKRAPAFRAVELKLCANEQGALVFKLPSGVLPTGYQPHVKEAPVEAPQEPEESAQATEVAPAPPAPQVGLQDRPIVLQFPKQTISIEQALAVLNRAKVNKGNNLRFTIEEGGYISAVHRIGK